MTPEQRNRNLAKARLARQRQLADRRQRREEEHSRARPAYERACRNYYRVRGEHGEGSDQEREAFRRMIRAECEWFRTHPDSVAGPTH